MTGEYDDAARALAAAGAAAREEWRSEQEAAARDAVEQWQHARTLVDVAREYMHRGDRVAITVAGHHATGEIVEVARDRLAVFDGDRRIDVHLHDALPLALRVVERARAGGRSGTRAVSFRARLLEMETAATRVMVATARRCRPDRWRGHRRCRPSDRCGP